MGQEVAACQVPHQGLVDRRIVEREVVDVLGERQLGDGDLVFALEEADEITSGDIN